MNAGNPPGGPGQGPGGWLLRTLLRLYSRSFRQNFGARALDVLVRDLHEAGRTGGLAPLRQAHLLAEFATHGVLDRFDRAVRTLREGSRGFWHGWTHDVRLAVRAAGRRWQSTAVAVLSLAIGVGANGVVFAVVDTFLLRDIPGVGNPDRVVELLATFRTGESSGWDYPTFRDVAAQVGLLESAAMFERGPVSLADDDQGRRLLALYVTSGYFPTMGVTLARGPGFTASVDEGAGGHPVTVLSWQTWQDEFAGDPDVVGRTVRLNRTPYTVVGVAPDAFRGHEFGLQPAVYLPLTQYPPAVKDPERFFGSRGTLWAGAVGRLAPGATVDEVDAALRTVARRLQEAHPDNVGRGAFASPAGLMPTEGRLQASVAFALLGALMLLVLAAASANVGGMLLARASARQREMAVRMALGSGRARIVRHLVTEAMVVFLLGGAGGVFLAVQGLVWFEKAALLPTFLPVSLDFALDGRVLAFGLALTTGVGLVFGLIPALGASRDHITVGLREGGEGRRAGRMRRAFVAGQVAVSILLLASAAVFLRSLRAGGEVDPGFEPRGVYLTGFDLALEGYGQPAEASVFLEGLLERVRGLPDVAGATVAGDFPLDGGTSSAPVWPDGRAAASGEGGTRAYYASVSDGYFATLGIPLVAGRAFGADDGATTLPVVVINRTLAERAWPDASPLGRVIEFGLEPRQYQVIGIVENTNSDLLTDRPASQVFTLLDQAPETDLFLAVRQRGASPDFVRRVRQEILSVDPALSLTDTRALADLAELGLLPQRLVASIAGLLGTLALFLSALGVYGVVAFMVTRRTREIGVRMALGSSRRGVLGGVLLDGLRLTWPGVAAGLVLAAALTTALRGLLIGVSPLDPRTYGAVLALFVLVIAAASLAPARRASAVEPATALRYD